MIKTNIQNIANYKKYLQVEEITHKFFKLNNYLKLDLPVLSPSLIPESYLEVFETEFKFLNKKQKLYLTPSPELFIKRLIAYGIGDCYFLGKAFRNSEPKSNLHFSEFNILEFYKIYQDYNFLKKVIQKLLLFINLELSNSPILKYGKYSLDFSKPWEEISIQEAFLKFAHIDKKELFNHKLFLAKAKEKGYKIDSFNYVDLFSQIYTQEIEPNLGIQGRPTIIYDYPVDLAALAKLNNDGQTSQRFEFYIVGLELGDCYTELTDPLEQQTRFEKEEENRKKIGLINYPSDWGFIKALEQGLPNCSGIAIGFDRLAMIFCNVDSISSLRLINIS